MKELREIINMIRRIVVYRSVLFVRAFRDWWYRDRTCKQDGCIKRLFMWQRGKYCTRHSRRVQTPLVILGRSKRS